MGNNRPLVRDVFLLLLFCFGFFAKITFGKKNYLGGYFWKVMTLEKYFKVNGLKSNESMPVTIC